MIDSRLPSPDMGDVGDELTAAMRQRQLENEAAQARWAEAFKREGDPNALRARGPRPGPNAAKVIGGVLAAAVLIGLVVAFANAGGSGPGSDTEQLNRQAAIDACEGSVREQLKAPGTADFGGVRAVKVGGRNYDVRGYVDAENSFGAKLRTAWTGGATTGDGGKTWRCSALVG